MCSVIQDELSMIEWRNMLYLAEAVPRVTPTPHPMTVPIVHLKPQSAASSGPQLAGVPSYGALAIPPALRPLLVAGHMVCTCLL